MTSNAAETSARAGSGLKPPSRAIRLFGTEEPVADPVMLKAGPLSAELENGNLRYIRFHGREMLRAVSFIVRDRNWGTYRPRIEDLRVEQAEDAFRVSYRASTGDERAEPRSIARRSAAARTARSPSRRTGRRRPTS